MAEKRVVPFGSQSQGSEAKGTPIDPDGKDPKDYLDLREAYPNNPGLMTGMLGGSPSTRPSPEETTKAMGSVIGNVAPFAGGTIGSFFGPGGSGIGAGMGELLRQSMAGEDVDLGAALREGAMSYGANRLGPFLKDAPQVLNPLTKVPMLGKIVEPMVDWAGGVNPKTVEHLTRGGYNYLENRHRRQIQDAATNPPQMPP